jgi:hypothetical protein
MGADDDGVDADAQVERAGGVAERQRGADVADGREAMIRPIAAACEQRLRCRIAIAVLVSVPQFRWPSRIARIGRMYEISMKQFLDSQDVPTNRTAAANAARRHCVELRS